MTGNRMHEGLTVACATHWDGVGDCRQRQLQLLRGRRGLRCQMCGSLCSRQRCRWHARPLWTSCWEPQPPACVPTHGCLFLLWMQHPHSETSRGHCQFAGGLCLLQAFRSVLGVLFNRHVIHHMDRLAQGQKPVLYVQAAALFYFMFAEAPNLALQPPLVLSPADVQRLQTYTARIAMRYQAALGAAAQPAVAPPPAIVGASSSHHSHAGAPVPV